MTVYLDIEDVVLIARRFDFVVRDLGELAAAVARPQASAFGEDAFETLPAKAAALLDGINRHHPLVDGNKRLAFLSTMAFLDRNGFDWLMEDSDMADLNIGVAAGTAPFEELCNTIAQHLHQR